MGLLQRSADRRKSTSSCFSGRFPAARHDPFNHGPGPCLRHAADDRHARLDDPCFLECDLLDAIPEHLRVVEADACDDRHQRRYDIRGVEAPTEADFDHGNVALLPQEMQEPQSRTDLEKERLWLAGRFPIPRPLA